MNPEETYAAELRRQFGDEADAMRERFQLHDTQTTRARWAFYAWLDREDKAKQDAAAKTWQHVSKERNPAHFKVIKSDGWRILHVPTSTEVSIEMREYPDIGIKVKQPPIDVYKYPTRQAAQTALDRWLACKKATL